MSYDESEINAGCFDEMTVDEKREAIICEFMACLKQICETSTNINSAKWLAAVALASANTISHEGRIPTTEESKEWVKRQGWAFLN